MPKHSIERRRRAGPAGARSPVSGRVDILPPMSAILIASLEAREGRTTVKRRARRAARRRAESVRLLRLRGDDEEPAAVEDDAATLARVPGCTGAERRRQRAGRARGSTKRAAACLIEAPPGRPAEAAERLDAKVVMVTSSVEDLRLSDVAAAATALGDRFAGALAVRQHEKGVERSPTGDRRARDALPGRRAGRPAARGTDGARDLGSAARVAALRERRRWTRG